uniref:Uncharacterized protein n=1 Tax=Haptolina brevifila TaxID=156173 RepID=A0A7S2DZN9_9EUKA|mmetsp:Transcript_46236/g.92283  ORF Transcript_46236/g.92283 Transcript_46236/m.92283 type:complete len:202 (+) Transcript_46236:3-608(+)
MISTDRHVYVCDRDRGLLFVHRTDGSFVSQISIPGVVRDTAVPHDPNARAFVGPWGVAFSPDEAQQYMYVSCVYQTLLVFNRRSMTLLAAVGGRGSAPGWFSGIHAVATTSTGDVFTTEVFHGRVQRYRLQGTTQARQGSLLIPTSAASNATAPATARAGPIYQFGPEGLFLKQVLHFRCSPHEISTAQPHDICGRSSWAF